MNRHTVEMIALAREHLRAASLFGSRNDVRLALEALEEIDELPDPPEKMWALEKIMASCEFCQAAGGGCCVCGQRN